MRPATECVGWRPASTSLLRPHHPSKRQQCDNCTSSISPTYSCCNRFKSITSPTDSYSNSCTSIIISPTGSRSSSTWKFRNMGAQSKDMWGEEILLVDPKPFYNKSSSLTPWVALSVMWPSLKPTRLQHDSSQQGRIQEWILGGALFLLLGIGAPCFKTLDNSSETLDFQTFGAHHVH